MADDTTDRQLMGWGDARPDLEVGALQVTARLTRVGAHLARRQEAVFGRFGLGRGEVGALSALRIAGPPVDSLRHIWRRGSCYRRPA